MKKLIGLTGGFATTGLVVAILSMNHCSTSSPTIDGVIGTSSAKLDTGTCNSGNWTCTTANGLDTCTCDTGVSYGCPIGSVCTLQDGGVQDYGFCGFKSIQGNFSYSSAAGSSTARIAALNGHWQMQFVMQHLGDQVSGDYNCARQSNFNPAGNFAFISGIYSVNTGTTNPASQTIPSSGHYVCPWTGKVGKAAGSTCFGYTLGDVFGVNPTSGANNEHVTRDTTTRCDTDTLSTESNCTNTGTASIAYGTAHPGNTSGWEYTLAGAATSHDLGAAVSDTLCYITEWDNEAIHLGGSDPYDHIWLSQSGGSPNNWVINKNYSYLSVKVTCIPYDQT